MIVDLAFSPLSILFFLGSCLSVFAGFAVLIFAKVTKREKLGRVVRMAMLAGAGVYVALLLGVSLFSKEYVLGRGAEKHYCEVDCHIAYSVTDVRQVKTMAEGGAKTAQGMFYVVTVRTRFDETTINPNRGNGVLHPNPRDVYALDEQGHHYAPLTAGAAALLEKPLRPGEWYDTQILFDLPVGAREPRLFIENASWENHLLIGHENSPLHKKAYFSLRG